MGAAFTAWLVTAPRLVWILADARCDAEQFDAAEESAARAVKLLEPGLGADHWRTVNARVKLAEIRKLASVSPTGHDDLRLAAGREQAARSAVERGEPREAIRLLGEAMRLRAGVLGERTRSAAETLDRLAVLAESLYDFPSAEESRQTGTSCRACTCSRSERRESKRCRHDTQ